MRQKPIETHKKGPKPQVHHPRYTTMEEMEKVGLIPREAQDYAKRQGVKFISTNRTVLSEPVRRFLFDFLRKIFTNGGSIENIEGSEIWDKDLEMAKKLREDRIKLQDERAIRQGDLVQQDVVDETIYEKWLGPARAQIEASQKNLKRQVRTILEGDGTNEAKTAQIESAITDQFEAMLKRMKDKIPQNKK
jgi:hypothetical protein